MELFFGLAVICGLIYLVDVLFSIRPLKYGWGFIIFVIFCVGLGSIPFFLQPIEEPETTISNVIDINSWFIQRINFSQPKEITKFVTKYPFSIREDVVYFSVRDIEK